jgi:class 3 adenylate cyclase
LSLSVKGDQQDISLICLRIKNIDRLKESKTDYEPVLQQIVNIAEEQKAYIYGAQDNVFLIYAPTKTKTFRNERTAIDTARKITDLVEEYNKLAREKIILGISANYGTIVAGVEENVMKFMGMGTLMNSAKRLATLSDGELLLSERMRDKLGPDIKTQKKEISGTTTYIIREIRDDEKSKEFIRRFLDRMDK